MSVPKMRDWSARADGTVVRVEYISMEKVEGVAFHQRYENLRSQDFEFWNQVIALERAFVSRRFSQIGRLYYKKDAEQSEARPLRSMWL
jgi:hypothetical protein